MFRTFLIAAALCLIVAPVCATTTTDNLQAAFNGESNAHARYLAFAEKAVEEGYPSVASLFRAAATAEKIHADNHAAVLTKAGLVPTASIENPDVKSTAENLAAAIKGETYERDTMYPEFLKVARNARETAAIRTFNYALKAEGEHAKLYADSLKKLASLKGVEETYYVCTVCGYTTTKVDFQRCPGCLTPKENYVAVS